MKCNSKSKQLILIAGLQVVRRHVRELEEKLFELEVIVRNSSSADSERGLDGMAFGARQARQAVLAVTEQIDPLALQVQLPLFADIPVS